MNVPARYPYNGRWQIVAMCWAFVAALTIAIFILPWALPRVLGVPLLAVFALLGVLTTLRRYVFKRILVIDEKEVWLPCGLLQLSVRRVVFAEISEVWEVFIPRTVVFCLRSHGKTYELVSTLLPDHETYLEVAGYIFSRVPGSDS
ncbi:MAG: hypothetical protein ACP5XB_20745 [Isosphaeraceae bacterium]